MRDLIPDPVLKEAKRLLDWYGSDESNPDEDTTLALSSFTIRHATAADREQYGGVKDDTFVITCASVELTGPLAEKASMHDDYEYLTGSGLLLQHVSDGVEQRRE